MNGYNIKTAKKPVYECVFCGTQYRLNGIELPTECDGCARDGNYDLKAKGRVLRVNDKPTFAIPEYDEL